MKQIEYIENNNMIKINTINDMDSEYINSDSYFPIASITKIFTIFIILILQQKNKLNINDKVSKYINHDLNDFTTITIKDLLNHTSGLKKIYECKYKFNKISLSAIDLFNIIINEKLFKFKKNKYNYSNIGYVLLGYIIEKVTNMKYWDVYNKYLFKPLKIKTYIGKPSISIYTKNKKMNEKDLYKIYISSTAGAYVSSINDLIKFSKNSMKLLNSNSRNILKTLYIYKNSTIHHKGNIMGGKSEIKIKYSNWKPNNIYIKLSTNN